jgi:YD repeat-containing protein
MDTEWRAYTYINTLGVNNTFTLDYVSPPDSFHIDLGPRHHLSDNRAYPFVLAASFRNLGLESDLVVVRNQDNFAKKIHFIDFTKNNSKDVLLTKVSQSNGAIIDEIEYTSMEPKNGEFGNLNEVYSSTESLEYPLVELKKIPSSQIVSKLKNTSLNVDKYQDYKYHGYSVNLLGIGAIGFKKTAKSSWYKAGDKATWTVTENDPALRGATTSSYTKIYSSQDNFYFNDTVGLLNKSENTYISSVDSISKRYTILLDKQTSSDNLTGIKVETTNNFYTPDYLLPAIQTVNKYEGNTLQGTTTTITEFENNISGTGNTYYIGRPKKIETINQAYSDTKKVTEKFFYTDNNLTRTEKTANSAPETIVETTDYFPNGLLKSKTLSATGTTTQNAVSPRTTSYTYDSTNRFIKTTTDTQGLVTTNNSYHNLYGMVLSQTNPLGQVTTSTYDNWGKPIKMTDFLGKSITYAYTRTGSNFVTTQTGDDGSATSSESDALARVIKKGIKDINNNWIYSDIEYDYLGKKTRESEPYFSNSSASLWTTYEYDDYGRNTKITQPTGKIINTTYNGLTVSVNDEILTKSKTMNANGHVVSTTDTPGGTITFKYNANGLLLESDYEGVKTTTTYDDWGRRISLTDSSAGTYTTQYNAFGETLIETTPKGTTEYTLDALGKPLTKKITGKTSAEKTNITSTYTYDPTYKWVTRIDVTNPNDGNSSYQYDYDTTTKQVKQSTETLPYATFTKSLTFDAFGRVDTETIKYKNYQAYL